MAEKNVQARIQHKHDTEANWNKATGFIPKAGELIVYDVDADHEYARVKIGDGVTVIDQLNFARDDGVVLHTEQTLTDEQKAQARTNINAVSIEEVEELLGIEEEFSETGNPLVLNLEKETELEVVSKISRQEGQYYYDLTKLTLHQIGNENIIDVASMFGGVGTVIEKNGLTMTINDDGTATVKGTSTASTLFDATIPKPKVVYPAGSYYIPTNRMMMSGLDLNDNGTGNKWGKQTCIIDRSFVLYRIRIEYGAGKTVDETIPINITLADVASESESSNMKAEYTVDFGKAVTEGEYNWTTGELKDADGNTVSYYAKQQIVGVEGINIFWTGFGEVTASNKSDSDLEKVVIRLGESAPAETVTSICDFTLTPTTPDVSYCLHSAKVTPGGTSEFFGHEISLITTKGTVSVVNSDGEVITEKYVDALINWQGATDLLTNKGIHKEWSEKFYFTKEPISQEDFSYSNGQTNSLYTFEFTEDDFKNTGLPAKLDNIPIVSPCFYTGANATNKLNGRIWGDGIFPATFSWDNSSSKYIFKVRGLNAGFIMHQLQGYTKGYFHYQLETPYDEPATFAMGISSGDTVTFISDDSDWKTYLDGGLYKDSVTEDVITEVDVTPTGFIYIPRNAADACDGMVNAARMLNNTGSVGGDATVQGYSWIGEGDGSTDYTSKIQSKLDVLHSVSDGGTIYLGPGTYPISGSLLVYDNTRIIGDGLTVIEQTADNTHALVLCGNGITIEDLSIKLSGACTAVTACVYINSYNKPTVDGYNSAFPETNYVQRLTIDNVFMSGEYRFGSENGYPVVSDAYEKYMGVGIYNDRQYFNYAHVDNVHFKYLHAGVYGGCGSNYFNITSEFCKYGLHIIGAGDNTYFVNGHPYYANDANGNYITMSEAIAYVESDTCSTYHLRTYDMQAYKMLAFLGPKARSNKIDIQSSLSIEHGLHFSHNWNILKWIIVDYGRGNVYSDLYKNTPFHIGSHTYSISNGPHVELSNPVIQNALSGAGIWGDISSNVEFTNYGIALRDVCRYPSEKTRTSKYLPYIVSAVAPSADSPIEIVIDYSNRPIIGCPNYFIQFHHTYVASDYVVSFDTTNTGVFDYELPVTGNTNITEYFDYPQRSSVSFITYRMKISFTKALQIEGLQNAMYDETFDYNPDGLIGICNIGMTVNDYAGRSFLGECGGSLYGNVDMHQNTLKNLPTPVDDGDAVSKAYLEERLGSNVGVQIIKWEADD